VYAREFDGKDYNFGVIGVDKGTLILYDDETRSRWSQLFGEAVSGDMEGKKLEKFASTMTTWKQWRDLHPQTTVYVKPSIPYSARFTGEGFRKIANSEAGPIRAEDLIVALEGHVDARAYLVRRLAKQRLLEDTFEGALILVYLDPSLSTAKVFSRTVDDRLLSFKLASAEELEDEETHSRWDPMTGKCVDGSLQGKQLQPLISTYSLWFAWKKYRPDTVVHGE
jgi:hypothetical protein